MKAANLIRPLRHIINLFLPQFCLICDCRLLAGEDMLCSSCCLSLPLTHMNGKHGNYMERLFWGKIDIARANAYMYYCPGAESTSVFKRFKYGNRPNVATHFGHCMALDLINTDFFTGIDLIVPVPLAQKRKRERGYNQSSFLARGVSEVTKLPIREDFVERTIDNPSQTSQEGTDNRKKNVEGVFQLINATEARGKHILIIDDVITYGFTLISCAQELAKAGNTRFSILTLGITGTHHRSSFTTECYPQGFDGHVFPINIKPT